MKVTLSIVASLFIMVLFTNCGQGFVMFDQLDLSSLGTPETPANLNIALKCDANLRGTGTEGSRRLTKDELVATLTSLFGADVMSATSVTTNLALIPTQVVSDNAHFDNAIVNVTGLESTAEAIVEQVFANATKLRSVIPNCTTAAVAACNDSLVGSFGTKVYRRPLNDSEKANVRALSTQVGGIDGVKEGVIRLLISPFFHQHMELGEDGTNCTSNCTTSSANIMKLSQYEVASRISYRLTGTMPDDLLLEAASKGSLNSVAAVEAEATRIMGTAAARSNWRRITRGWLGLAKVSDPANVVATDAGIAAAGFGEEALQEALMSSEYGVFDQTLDFGKLMTNPVAVPYTDRLAKVYGTSRSPAAVTIPADRGGLLLKPAVLVSGNTTSSPIARGIFVIRQVMCGTMPDPNFSELNERNNEVTFSHVDVSNREYVTRLTSPTNCVGCHSVINPVGFALEKYSPLGIPRDLEIVYGENSRLATHPINTAVVDAWLGSRRVNLADAKDLVKTISESEEARQCLSKAIVINTGYRAKSDADNCVINSLTSSLVEGKSIKEVLVKSVANEEIFYTSTKGIQ